MSENRPAMDASARSGCELDEPPEPEPAPESTAFDVLKIRDFRRIFLASFASNMGRWMQNVALGVFAYELTESPTFTTFIIFAQLSPMLLLSVVGGSLADSVDRRKLLLFTQAWQALWGLVLAWQVLDDDISQHLLVGIVFMIGIGQALFAPAFTAVVPSLVGPRDLGAAISLNSIQVNGSRVLGPALGAALLSATGIAELFALNSATYLLIIGALFVTPMPPVRQQSMSAADRLLGGFRVATRVPQVGRPLAIMSTFSLLCLPFIGLMPVLAEHDWNVDAESTQYGLIYAIFGCGALVGAALAGTVLVRLDKEKVVRTTLAGFAVALATLSQVRSGWVAAGVLFWVGTFYFVMPTALNTFLQQHLADEVRGRVMALWVLSFGGVVSLNNLVSGAVVEVTSTSLVLTSGAAVALVLAALVRLTPGKPVGNEVLSDPARSATES
ncbi:MAG: MFS transporter [Acidimicrobiales bacterium]